MQKNKKKHFNRREFIGLGALGTMGLMLPQCRNPYEDIPHPTIPSYHTPAIVIGTGFGGAVAALRLGQAGIKTTVLERGQEWPVTNSYDTFSDQVSPDGRSTWLRNETVLPLPPHSSIDKYTGVLERVDFDTMQIYTGAGVGGGSLVYGGMTVQPRQDHFETIFPSEIDYAEMDAIYYPRVKSMLNASVISDILKNSDYYHFADIFHQQATNAGLNTRLIDLAYDWNIVEQELNGSMPESALKGELIYGNNNGCKNSLDKNYLAQARATGKVGIYALHQVDEITKKSDGRFSLQVQKLDEFGNVLDTSEMTCDYLFLCAGSVGTTKLLLKAKVKNKLPLLNSFVGQGWGSNGNVMFKRQGIITGTGTIQANPPIRALEHYNNPHTPVLIENAPFPIGAILPGVDCYCLLHLGVGLDTARGHYFYDQVNDDIGLFWPNTGNDTVVQALDHTVNMLNDANWGVESLDITVDPSGYTRDFTYHPCGGAVIGDVTDYYGRVEGYNKMYVVDGALMPGSSACANPSWTIAALAERCMDNILANDFPASS